MYRFQINGTFDVDAPERAARRLGWIEDFITILPHVTVDATLLESLDEAPGICEECGDCSECHLTGGPCDACGRD